VLPLDNPRELAGLVSHESQSGDVVVLLGAGDITNWAYALPDELTALGKAAE
jgi:UDP-N-acetylmuramate--alanine ligase